MSRSIVLLGLLLVGCGNAKLVDLNGQKLVVEDLELRQSLRGERVAEMFVGKATPIAVGWSDEVEDYIRLAGEQEARQLCGGEVELVSLTRSPFAARATNLRFRCL